MSLFLIVPAALVLLTMAWGEWQHQRQRIRRRRLPKAQVFDFTAYQHERERRFHRG